MTRTNLLLMAGIFIAASLSGCAGLSPSNIHPDAVAIVRNQPASPMPVVVVPNCYYLAGEHRCQWIEPKGYEPSNPDPITQTRIQGIAL